jgi:hypothetical protein
LDFSLITAAGILDAADEDDEEVSSNSRPLSKDVRKKVLQKKRRKTPNDNKFVKTMAGVIQDDDDDGNDGDEDAEDDLDDEGTRSDGDDGDEESESLGEEGGDSSESEVKIPFLINIA